MSAIALAHDPRHHGVCADRSRKSGEGSCEDTDEALNEGSDDAPPIRVRSVTGRSHLPVDIAGWGRASTAAPRQLCERVEAGARVEVHAYQGAERRK
jgi:hypothetical protein